MFTNYRFLQQAAILLFVFTGISAQEAPISIYGYLDLIGRDVFAREFPNGAIENQPPTFILLRTHIILNSRMSKTWQVFTNIRFQNGADLGSGHGHNDKGEIELLEGWFEYRHRSWLRIRGGKFLAPFGYFNTRKFQSPIFYSVVLPVMYEEEFLHRAAAGSIIPPTQNLQILGEVVKSRWRLGYHIYSGNGSSTNEHGLDLNENKGIGGRVKVESPERNFLLGASIYSEEGFFDIRPHIDMKAMMAEAQSQGVAMSEIVPILPVVNQSETRSTKGIDARFLYGNLEIRGEFVKSSISALALVDANGISDTLQTYMFDSSNFSKTFYYAHLNYTFFDKLTPFMEVNVFKDPRHFVFRNELTRLTWGIAFRPNLNVLLKAEYHNHLFGTEFNMEPANFKSFQMFWTAISIFFK